MDATDLAYAGAARQAALVAGGEVSARELLEACLERIERLDPQLNAFRAVFAERALAEAAQADARRGAGDRRPLLGVPVAIKDDADVGGEPTFFGTAAAHPRPAPADDEVVRRLRAAGAVLLGKTHVPELEQWPFTESLTFGATRNPWSLDHTPGGSGGGAGAAVAAGLCGLSLAADGAGSIRIPAAFCGVFGLKPQRGRIPMTPPDAWYGLSVNGPISRTVADAALFLDATADGAPEGGYARAAATPPPRLRVAVSTKLPPGVVARLGGDQRAAVEATAELLGSLGHEVIRRDPRYPPTAALDVLARFLGGVGEHATTLAFPLRLERRTRVMAGVGRALPAGWLLAARDHEAALARGVGVVFERADVLLTPGPTGPPWRIGALHGAGALRTLVRSANLVPYLAPFNATGQPAACVPAGLDRRGMPVGVQLVAPPGREDLLLSLAAQLEAARPWADRRPPAG